MTGQNPIRILADQAAVPGVLKTLSRRNFLVTASVAAAGGALLSACGSSGTGKSSTAAAATGGPLEDTVSMYSWGEYDAPEVLDAFTREKGPKLIVDAFGSNEELIAKLTAAHGTGGYDVVVPSSIYVPEMVHNGLLMKLNKDLIPNLSNMNPSDLGLKSDPNNDYSICKAKGSTGFVYDTTVIKRDLRTWNDFLDAATHEASRKTTVLDDPALLAGPYFWANGIDWTTTNPADLDAAENYLVNTLAPHIVAFESSPGLSVIPQSTAALMQAWNGDARQGLLGSKQPEKWKWVLGAPVTEKFMDTWAISSTAPHPEAAHAFLNFVLEPKNELASAIYHGHDTGSKGLVQQARDAGFKLPEMAFFTPEQEKTMAEGAVNEATARLVDIYNKTKAAAGA
jgi:spermidine/putrescine transport system substrate-binding protein